MSCDVVVVEASRDELRTGAFFVVHHREQEMSVQVGGK